jgi:hypothetical protein
VLAANFGQIANNSKHESDDDSDGDSLYLSAKEDSDSTGFLSAVGSRSNLQLFGRLIRISEGAVVLVYGWQLASITSELIYTM